MRLLVVSSWFPYPPDNGSKMRAYHLLGELSKRHDITLLSFAEPGEEKNAGRLGGICRSVRSVPGNPNKAGGALGWRGLFSPLPRSYQETYTPEMQAQVNNALTSHDAAIALQIGSALYLAHASGILRIFDEAEASVFYEQFKTQRHPLKRLRYGLTWWKFARFMRRLVDRFDATTVVSGNERALFARMGCDAERIQVVSNGVDAGDLRVNGAPTPAALIYPGALTYSANYDAVRHFLSDIFPQVRQARPDATFAVTGSTDGVALDALPRRDGVTFTGYLPDVKPVVADSDVCVVPLRVGGGTRLKIIQSLALGTPVVSTAKGAQGLDVTPERDILIADAPRAFAEQVVRVVNDRGLRARLSANGKELVARRYTWDRIAQQLDALLARATPSGTTAKSLDMKQRNSAPTRPHDRDAFLGNGRGSE